MDAKSPSKSTAPSAWQADPQGGTFPGFLIEKRPIITGARWQRNEGGVCSEDKQPQTSINAVVTYVMLLQEVETFRYFNHHHRDL